MEDVMSEAKSTTVEEKPTAKKKPYAPPRIESEEEFEGVALACTKGESAICPVPPLSS
jgi:hypothetical protein